MTPSITKNMRVANAPTLQIPTITARTCFKKLFIVERKLKNMTSRLPLSCDVKVYPNGERRFRLFRRPCVVGRKDSAVKFQSPGRAVYIMRVSLPALAHHQFDRTVVAAKNFVVYAY